MVCKIVGSVKNHSLNVALVSVHCARRAVFLYRIKPEELYILSFEKGRGRRPSLFSKLRI